MPRNDEHESSFLADFRRLEEEQEKAVRAAEVALLEVERQRVSRKIARLNALGGYCSDPKCKAWHPPDNFDDERPIAA